MMVAVKFTWPTYYKIVKRVGLTELIYEGIVRPIIYYPELFNLKPKTLREEGDNFQKLILFINIIKRIDLLSLLTIGGICPKIKTLNHQFKCW